jgi:hypothetical protein
MSVLTRATLRNIPEDTTLRLNLLFLHERGSFHFISIITKYLTERANIIVRAHIMFPSAVHNNVSIPCVSILTFTVYQLIYALRV